MAAARTESVQVSALGLCLQAGEPVLLWGDPGVGKTATVMQMARIFSVPIEVVIASIREPTDFSGLPMITRRYPEFNKELAAKVLAVRLQLPADEISANLEQILMLTGVPMVQDGEVIFAPPRWARNLHQAKKGFLFLDELSTARPAVQTALLRVVFERVVGDLALPPGIRIVAAANPPDEIAGGWDLTPPLANRFCHLDWQLDAQAWCDGFLYDWPAPRFPRLPKDWRDEIHGVKKEVAGFIFANRECLLQKPKAETEAGKAWPSPRSWEMATRLYAACRKAGASEEVRIRLIAGCVGPGPGLQFGNYIKELDLPNPELLLENPYGVALPTRDDQLYAALGSVVNAVRSNNTASRWNACWKVLERAAKQNSVDVAVAHAFVLAEARPQGAAVPPEVRPFVDILREAQAI